MQQHECYHQLSMFWFFFCPPHWILLNIISFPFQGSKVTIMGQNGAGKSSIIKLLNGSLQVHLQRVYFFKFLILLFLFIKPSQLMWVIIMLINYHLQQLIGQQITIFFWQEILKLTFFCYFILYLSAYPHVVNRFCFSFIHKSSIL